MDAAGRIGAERGDRRAMLVDNLLDARHRRIGGSATLRKPFLLNGPSPGLVTIGLSSKFRRVHSAG